MRLETVRPGVREFWDEFADRYDGRFAQRSGDGHALRVRQAAVLRLLGEGPGDVLDAGMGPGQLCLALAARGWTVWGVDASAEMVSLARRRLPGAKTRLLQGSIEALPFDDATFDRVTTTGVLEYTNVPSALAELARVLRPRGVAVISYPHRRAVYHLWKAWLYYPLIRGGRRVTGTTKGLPRGAGSIAASEFERLLERVGLTPTDRVLTSALVVPAPLDTLFPTIAERLARLVEGGAFARAILSTQVVYRAEKPSR